MSIKNKGNITCFSPDIEKICVVIQNAAKHGALKKAVLSKPSDDSVKKAVMTLRNISGRVVLQTETFTADNKALHTNTETSDSKEICRICSSFGQINVITMAGECEYKRSKSGKEIVIGANKLTEEALAANGGEVSSRNDKEKNYILRGDEDFLKLLGVSDANGRVHDKKRPKFRQINRFLEHIRDIVRYLPSEGEIRICDLCCGKSYLSFAVYHYFSNILGRKVNMTGVDLKRDVVEYCSSVSEKLGFEGLEFICGDITKYETDKKPELVISLHACDTATDIVLEKAIEWKAKVILSTPCCHHELNHTLCCPELSFIAQHSMLRQKLCDAATDALRLKLLESKGYGCDALELIDPEETPKNIMLRAVLRKNPSKASLDAACREYEAARSFLLGQK
ncbi:MAG: SAM-dependent methyltransferase [Clostridia bacterium]|nr:SAM-dependent methyltransferase [Clostridia bacterium]